MHHTFVQKTVFLSTYCPITPPTYFLCVYFTIIRTATREITLSKDKSSIIHSSHKLLSSNIPTRFSFIRQASHSALAKKYLLNPQSQFESTKQFFNRHQYTTYLRLSLFKLISIERSYTTAPTCRCHLSPTTGYEQQCNYDYTSCGVVLEQLQYS